MSISGYCKLDTYDHDYVDQWQYGRSLKKVLLSRTDAVIANCSREIARGLAVEVGGIAARSEPLEPKPAVAERTMELLRTSQFDWLTPDWIARELDVDESDIRSTLAALGSEVRRPVGAVGREREYYRLSAKPLTRQERMRRLRAIVTGTTLADSNF